MLNGHDLAQETADGFVDEMHEVRQVETDADQPLDVGAIPDWHDAHC
ncbi:MAG: hypothetical protein V3T56_09880 [Gemmatimonadales bacterium]